VGIVELDAEFQMLLDDVVDKDGCVDHDAARICSAATGLLDEP
jgi:hypothetical protein